MLRAKAEAQALACQPSDRAFTFIAPMGFQHPMTRAYAKLLGPCFKTGRRDDQLLHREQTREREPNHRPTTRHRMRYHCSETTTEPTLVGRIQLRARQTAVTATRFRP